MQSLAGTHDAVPLGNERRDARFALNDVRELGLEAGDDEGLGSGLSIGGWGVSFMV